MIGGRTLDIKTPVTYETSIQLGPTAIEIRVSLIPLPGDNLGMIIENIKERKSVERMKNEFVSTVSHELRTPLTSIRGALGLIEGKVFGDLSNDVMEVVGIARTSSDRLIRLINDILDIEKLDAGKVEFRMARIDVKKMVETTVDVMEHLAHENGMRLAAHVDDDVWIMADADRMEQVLTNLVSNALKFSPRDSTVYIDVRRMDSWRIRFSVRDEGQGISEADQARLFGRFQQIDSSDGRRQGGTGLGLAICKAIVEQHGGMIGVLSEVGKGSTFFFELNAAPAPN